MGMLRPRWAATTVALIQGVTDVLARVLNKSPAATFVVIDEVDLDNWGVGGLPLEEYRRKVAAKGP
jgi:4-oxalocrotonate tautomerase